TPLFFHCRQVVVTAHVDAADEDLGHGAPAARALDHLALAHRVVGDVDLLEANALAREQRSGAHAGAAPVLGVEDDVGQEVLRKGRRMVALSRAAPPWGSPPPRPPTP